MEQQANRQPRHLGCQEITLDGFLAEIQDVSSGPHPRKFCFVLGAGASKSSGIKSGQELVDLWDRDLQVRNPADYKAWRERNNITDENKYNHYGHYYAKRFERDNTKNVHDGYNYLEKVMECAQPNIGYAMLALIMQDTAHNVVITTNFDHLVEDSVTQFGQTLPLVIGHESLAKYGQAQVSRPTVIKIHRDLLLDPINAPEDLARLNPAWEETLDYIFSNYHPIFIGYAGNDQSVMNFLAENSKKFDNGTWGHPYWFLYDKAAESGKSTKQPEKMVQEFLEKSSAILIRHSGFDRVMVSIAKALDCKLPKRETFIKKAEDQYQALMDAMSREMAGSGGNPPSGNPADELTFCTPADQPPASEGASQETTPETTPKSGTVENASADVLSMRASMEYTVGNYEEAARLLQGAIRLRPEVAAYHFHLGNTLNELEQYDEAVREYREAIRLRPEVAAYHFNLGNTLDELEQYDEAVREYREAIRLRPGDADYHNNLANTFSHLGRQEEALAEVRQAIQLAPNDPDIQDTLSEILCAIGQYQEALEASNRAIALYSYDPYFYRNRAKAYRALGWENEALADEKKAEELETE